MVETRFDKIVVRSKTADTVCQCLMILSCSCAWPANESKKVITCYDDIMNKPTATTEELGLCLIEYKQNY